jgi:hypothetical protein
MEEQGNERGREVMGETRKYIAELKTKPTKEILITKNRTHLYPPPPFSIPIVPQLYSIPSNLLILLSRNSPATISKFMIKRFQRA